MLHRTVQRFNRRGVAMLLVIISLMMASVLTTAYLASRDNSAAIGENVASAAAARWTADSGLEFGLAVLQTESAWRTSHSAGRLVTGYPIAGGTMDLDLMDLETGSAPTAATEYVRMTSSAVVDGVEQTAIANCHVPLASGAQVDVDLSEFAAFTSQRIEMKNNSTITRWPRAPLSTLGSRVLLGTQATSAASVALSEAAASVDSTVYYGPGASSMLVSIATGQAPEKSGLFDAIPLPASPASGVAAPLIVSLSPVLTMNGGAGITSSSIRWKSAELRNNATRTLRGAITVVTDEDLRINSGSKLVIDGNVKLVVFGDLIIDTAAIELRSGAKLLMHVRGDSGNAFDMQDGYIGNLRTDSARDATGKSPYMDPERVLIFSLPASSSPTWRMDKNSVVKGSIYAPDATSFQMTKQSALYGRVATKTLTMADDAAIFYDPALNDHVGYTESTAPMWDGSSRLKNEFKTLTSLDAGLLQSVANATGLILSALTKDDPKYTPAAASPTTPVVVGPTDPSPRPVEVDYELVTFGNALNSWE